MAELVSVMTRPKSVNGIGASVEEALEFIALTQAGCALVQPNDSEARYFVNLVRKLRPQGKRVHDIRHIAAMMSLGVPYILTLNPRDFAGAQEAGYIHVLTPEEILS